MKFNFWDFQQFPTFRGVYIGSLPQVGKFKKRVHIFKIGKAGEIHIWGSAILNKKLYNIKFGSFVKIIYKGKIKTEKSRYPTHQFDVITGETGEAITANN